MTVSSCMDTGSTVNVIHGEGRSYVSYYVLAGSNEVGGLTEILLLFNADIDALILGRNTFWTVQYHIQKCRSDGLRLPSPSQC
jgi:hypothetical protein